MPSSTSGQRATAQGAGERRNILLILTDQQRWDTLGCYGAPTCQTPHLDALAERGVRFDAAYTAAVACSPSRAALFTGRYPRRTRVLANDGLLNPELPNLASELSAAGYRLGYAGKWHVDAGRVPTHYGFQGLDFLGYGYPIRKGAMAGMRLRHLCTDERHFDRYLAEHGLAMPEVLQAHYGDNPSNGAQEIYALQSGTIESSFEHMACEETIRLLHELQARRQRDGAPFFLWTNFWGPHTPCLLPEPYYSLYDPAAIPVEPTFGETFEDKPYVQRLVERFWGLSTGGWPRWREIVARYWGYVTMLDDLIGRIVGAVQELGLAESTLIAFSTDHGDCMGAHRLLEKGPFAYEETHRVPLLVVDPACSRPGSVCSEFVYLQDLLPTFLEAAGRDSVSAPDTASLLDLARGGEVSIGRDSIYSQFYALLFPFELRMMRTRGHKLVYNRSDRGELYDLVADPGELTNLYGLPRVRGIQEELLARMREHMVRLDDPILGAFDAIRLVY